MEIKVKPVTMDMRLDQSAATADQGSFKSRSNVWIVIIGMVCIGVVSFIYWNNFDKSQCSNDKNTVNNLEDI